MSRKITATIHLAALQHNLAQIKGHLQSATKIVAVIKADGYGHGLLRVARALYKADMFAVGCLDEAAELRSNAIDKPTLLLEGFEGESELRAISDLKLDTVIHSEEQWGLLQSIVLQKKISIWLKVDTGMSRLGFSPTRAEQILPVLESHPSIDRVVLISHFANANDPTHSLNGEQQQRFEQCCHTIPERSLANSAATILNNSAHYQFVRPGIALYGSSPLLNQGEAGYDLRPAMTLQAPLIAVKKIAQGESVGYGSNWQAPEGAVVGVVAIGYGHGYPRKLTTGTPVLIRGERVTLVGRVSMDLITIDLTSTPAAQVGDMVTLWGEGLPVDEIAAAADTISYELLCQLTSRVVREDG